MKWALLALLRHSILSRVEFDLVAKPRQGRIRRLITPPGNPARVLRAWPGFLCQAIQPSSRALLTAA